MRCSSCPKGQMLSGGGPRAGVLAREGLAVQVQDGLLTHRVPVTHWEQGWMRPGGELVGYVGGARGGHQPLGGGGGGVEGSREAGRGKVFEEIYSDAPLREGHLSRGSVYKNFLAC